MQLVGLWVESHIKTLKPLRLQIKARFEGALCRLLAPYRWAACLFKEVCSSSIAIGSEMGTPNWEPQEHSRNVLGIVSSYDVPTIFLWGVPIKVP